MEHQETNSVATVDSETATETGDDGAVVVETAGRPRFRRPGRRSLVLAAAVVVLVAVISGLTGLRWQSDLHGDLQADAASETTPETPGDDLHATLAYLVKTAGDMVRLDNFHATDETIRTLADVERLRVIRIDGGRLSAEAGRSLAAMPHLEQLHLRRVQVDDGFVEALADSQTIWLINLTASPEVSHEAIARLAEMPRLRQLRLVIAGGGNRYARAVASMRRLRHLHLIGIAVNDEGLERLASLPHLESLYLDESAVSEQGWLWLFEHHPQLHVHIDQKHHDRDPQKH